MFSGVVAGFFHGPLARDLVLIEIRHSFGAEDPIRNVSSDRRLPVKLAAEGEAADNAATALIPFEYVGKVIVDVAKLRRRAAAGGRRCW